MVSLDFICLRTTKCLSVGKFDKCKLTLYIECVIMMFLCNFKCNVWEFGIYLVNMSVSGFNMDDEQKDIKKNQVWNRNCDVRN